MEVFDEKLISELLNTAERDERLRTHFDLRTTQEDSSQRLLNAMIPGTKVPIHRHKHSSETIVCIEGCLDFVFYEMQNDKEVDESFCNGEVAKDESAFVEVARYRLCPQEKLYGIQVPMMAWHTVEVYEPSVIMIAKDGKYGER